MPTKMITDQFIAYLTVMNFAENRSIKKAYQNDRLLLKMRIILL